MYILKYGHDNDNITDEPTFCHSVTVFLQVYVPNTFL